MRGVGDDRDPAEVSTDLPRHATHVVSGEVGVSEMNDARRVAAIRQAFRDCGQEPTEEAVAKQFRYETGRGLPAQFRRCARFRDDDGVIVRSADGECRVVRSEH